LTVGAEALIGPPIPTWLLAVRADEGIGSYDFLRHAIKGIKPQGKPCTRRLAAASALSARGLIPYAAGAFAQTESKLSFAANAT